MKRYIATWFNPISNGGCTINLLAKDEEEAKELAIMFMDAEHPFYKHNDDCVLTLRCLDDEMGFYTRAEIEELYTNAMKKHNKKE